MMNHQSHHPIIIKESKMHFTNRRNIGIRRTHPINSYDHIKRLRVRGLIDTHDLINSC